MDNLQYFASAGSGGSDLFASLGIDWRLFAMQTIAFIILLLVLKKWVYPPILAALDKRDASIKEGLEAAEQAKKAASESEERTAVILKKARHESQTIVATAKVEASNMVAEAEQKAKSQADFILESARNKVKTEISQAKEDLCRQMVDLVVDTTKKVTLDTVDPSRDTSLIEKQLEEVK